MGGRSVVLNSSKQTTQLKGTTAAVAAATFEQRLIVYNNWLLVEASLQYGISLPRCDRRWQEQGINREMRHKRTSIAKSCKRAKTRKLCGEQFPAQSGGTSKS